MQPCINEADACKQKIAELPLSLHAVTGNCGMHWNMQGAQSLMAGLKPVRRDLKGSSGSKCQVQSHRS